MGTIEEMFEPNLGVYYCNYFYWLLVIYFVLAIIQLGDLGMSMVSHSKNLNKFMREDMMHRLTQFVSIIAQFIIVRIFYSMCAKSMAMG
jgi:hypothetical protein